MKMKWRKLFLLVFLICIILIFAATISLKVRKVSPKELFLRCVFVGYVLMQKPPPMPPPSEVFRQHVLDPIPESVTNIKADQPKNILGYRYTLRFNINRADLAKLINSGPLVRVWNVKYGKGRLKWAWDTWHGHSMSGSDVIVYKRREPAWFRPELWDNPEAYAFDETVGGRMNTKVLLYNEKEDEAYFIVSRLK